MLNPLAIKLNIAYNKRHNSTQMRLNGKTLYGRLKCYKTKYMCTKEFSKKTGIGLSAKDDKRGIQSMKELYEYMCPCFKEMDIIFWDKGNVNPFGIFDSGLSPENSDDDDDKSSNNDSTDGYDHSLEGAQGSWSFNKSNGLVTEVPMADIAAVPSNSHASTENNANDKNAPEEQVQEAAVVIASRSKVGMSKGSKRKRPKKENLLTAEERALDSSEDDIKANQEESSQNQSRSRATLSRRPLDPLPSFNPSIVRSREAKHPVATAMQLGNQAKLEMMRSAQEADLEAQNASLSWQKERFFIERENEDKKAAIALRNDRQAFCEKLVLSGKAPAEIEAFLRLVYPD